MKLLYILVSNCNDYYYEQAFLSILSVKYQMPEMQISMLVDDDTKDSLVGPRKKIFEFVDELKVVKFEKSVNPIVRSRELKTTMREKITGDFLYVDVDTLWVAPIEEKDFSSDIMGVPDGHVEFSDFVGKKFHCEKMKSLNLDFFEKFYINGGVLFVRDTPVAHQFMQEWNRYWQYCCERGSFTDQQSLNYVNSKMGGVIQLMPHSYNVQIVFSVRYLLNAKVIHYFATNLQSDERKLLFDLQKKSFWDDLKKSENYLDKMKNIVRNPNAFFSPQMVSVDIERERIENMSYGLLCTIIDSNKTRAKVLLRMLNSIAQIIVSAFKFFQKN